MNEPIIQVTWPGDLPLDARPMRNHGDSAVHRHEFSELVIVLSGSAIHVSPWGEYTITAGDAFLLHGDQAHGYRDTSSLELVNILFMMDQLRIPMRDMDTLPGYHALFTLEPAFRREHGFESRLRLSPEQMRAIKERVRQLIVERESAAPGWRFAMSAHFMLTIADLCRFYSKMDNPATLSLLRLGEVIGYLHRNYAEQITLDDLARVGCVSRRTLTREFSKGLGISPIEYLIRERINRALVLLRDNGATVAEAAFAVGFHDSNYFSRAFRKQVGQPPSLVRHSALEKR